MSVSKIIELPLTQGQVALIDEADAEKAARFKWTVLKIYRRKRQMFYARRTVYPNGKKGKSKTILLHRFLTDAPTGLEVDHINGNGLDCRRKNLRFATRSQNRCNAQYLRNPTGFRGVVQDKRHSKQRYIAKIMVNGKTHRLGCFETALEAARTYDAKAKELHGEFAALNFPDNI